MQRCRKTQYAAENDEPADVAAASHGWSTLSGFGGAKALPPQALLSALLAGETDEATV